MRTLLSLIFLDSRFETFRYRCAIFLYLVVLVLGAIPGAREDVGELASGLVLHSLTYAVLTLLVFTGSHGGAPGRAVKSVLTIMAMGAMDEFVQSFLPYRMAAFSDWLIDCSAALLTAAILWNIWPKTGGNRDVNHQNQANQQT